MLHYYKDLNPKNRDLSIQENPTVAGPSGSAPHFNDPERLITTKRMTPSGVTGASTLSRSLCIRIHYKYIKSTVRPVFARIHVSRAIDRLMHCLAKHEGAGDAAREAEWNTGEPGGRARAACVLRWVTILVQHYRWYIL